MTTRVPEVPGTWYAKETDTKYDRFGCRVKKGVLCVVCDVVGLCCRAVNTDSITNLLILDWGLGYWGLLIISPLSHLATHENIAANQGTLQHSTGTKL